MNVEMFAVKIKSQSLITIWRLQICYCIWQLRQRKEGGKVPKYIPGVVFVLKSNMENIIALLVWFEAKFIALLYDNISYLYS